MLLSKGLSLKCFGCETCWKPYQTVPLLGIFHEGAKVLVIGQNPAIMRYDEEENEYKQIMESETLGAFRKDEAVLMWYRKWFLKSNAYRQMGETLLWPNWLADGKVDYTNAVRCRTPRNQQPNWEVSAQCRELFTKQILEAGNYDVVITMGALASKQMSEYFQYGKTYVVRKQGVVKYRWMPVYHYAARMQYGVFEQQKKAIQDLLISSSTES